MRMTSIKKESVNRNFYYRSIHKFIAVLQWEQTVKVTEIIARILTNYICTIIVLPVGKVAHSTKLYVHVVH